jgi:hypothetical protein
MTRPGRLRLEPIGGSRCNDCHMRRSIARLLGIAVCCFSVSMVGASAAAGDRAVAGEECSPTQPNGYTPPGSFSSHNHGAGPLVVNLWIWPSLKAATAANAASLVRADGAVRVKMGWWRVEPGELTLAARRIDGPAPAPQVSVGTVAAYGERGFVSSSLLFATRGCYEVVGRLGEAELAFVVHIDVGAERWSPPVAAKPSVSVRRGVATVRWRRGATGVRFDSALRRGSGPWRLIRKAFDSRTKLVVRPRLAGRYSVRIRPHDDFGAGPWSAPAHFQIR